MTEIHCGSVIVRAVTESTGLQACHLDLGSHLGRARTRKMTALKAFDFRPPRTRVWRASKSLHRATPHKDRPPYTSVRAVQRVSERLRKSAGQVVRQTGRRLNRCLMGALGWHEALRARGDSQLSPLGTI